MKLYVYLLIGFFISSIGHAHEQCFKGVKYSTCFSPLPNQQGQIVTVRHTDHHSSRTWVFQAIVDGYAYTLWDGGRPDCKTWYPYVGIDLTSVSVIKDFPTNKPIYGNDIKKYCGSYIQWSLNVNE